MFISSQESSHRMKMLQFNTNGILLKTFHKNPGYTIFNIRIYEHLRLDDDPKIQCKNYMKPKDYAEVVWSICNVLQYFHFQCLDEDFKDQVMNALNCSPPYITDKKDLWCKESMNMSLDAESLLIQINNGKMQSKTCLPPCKITR